ncbi:MAG: hypothetical protein Fur0041_10360 [Bacteroidia bacterium]
MKKLLIPFVMAVILASCKAGSGGDATVVVSPKHHGVPILSTSAYRDSVFIKFNATDLPENPTTNYDLLFVGTPGEAIIKCDGLKAGKYFIYATGWDPAINERVVGGVALKIKYKERKDELAVEVPVVE